MLCKSCAVLSGLDSGDITGYRKEINDFHNPINNPINNPIA
jgi:hypothetical protein